MLHLLTSILIIITGIVTECSAACPSRGIECIEGVVLGKYQGYEVRQLPGVTWVSTSIEGTSLTEANIVMYKRLLSYVQGNNDKGIKINTTAPVRTRIEPCHGVICASVFIMSFPVPSELIRDAPNPLDPLVFIDKDAPQQYAVRKIEGKPTEEDWLKQARTLANLTKENPTIKRNRYYIVLYDSPYQIFHSVNEIWLGKRTVFPRTSNPDKR